VGGNITAVLTDDGIVMTDSSISSRAGKQARDLIEARFPDVPIKYLINTHHHSDHVRGNQHFRDTTIIAHVNLDKYLMDEADRLTREYGHYEEKIGELEERLEGIEAEMSEEGKKVREELSQWKERKAFLEEYVPISAGLQITSDMILKLGGKTFEILHFDTAHTDNDLVVLVREDRLLIMGDLLCYRKCYVLNPRGDARNWIALLEELIERRQEYDYVVPGHGGVVLTVEAMIEQRDYLKVICDAVDSARDEGLTLEQAKDEIRLEQYRGYIDYDRIGLDLEACWKQVEK
jgi:glyoxylase-like metal-dependent hydrolase (beta-lactamase superfamily II)